MNHILQTIFLEDVFNSLDIKYKNLIPYSKEKFFTYANIYKIPLYYKLFTYKKHPDYNLYNKLTNYKQYEVIELCVKKIHENNYDNNLILLLYSYICNIVFNNYFDEYITYKAKYKRFSTKKTKMNKFSKASKCIEAQFYEERYYKNIKKYKLNTKKLLIDDISFETLDDIFSKLFLNSYGIDVFKKSYDNFIKYQKQNYKGIRFVNRFIAKILDLFTRTKKYSASSIYHLNYISNKDYLNKENDIWKFNNSETNKSFYELYEEAISVAKKFTTIISERIYYKIKNDEQIKKLLDEINK